MTSPEQLTQTWMSNKSDASNGYWNIDGSRDLSEVWTIFTQFTSLKEKPPNRYMWCWGPDHLWPEDKEFKETIKNARKKLETPIAPTMPCKMSKNNQNWVTRGKMRLNQNLHVSWKPMNPQECAWQNLYRNVKRTILQEEGTIHCNITIWHTTLSHASINEDTRSKSRSGQGMGKQRKFQRETWRNKSEVIEAARTKGIKVHFVSLVDICPSRLPNWRQSSKYKERVVLRSDIVKDVSGSHAVFTEQGSSASNDSSKSHGCHLKIAWLYRTSSGRSIC